MFLQQMCLSMLSFPFLSFPILEESNFECAKSWGNDKGPRHLPLRVRIGVHHCFISAGLSECEESPTTSNTQRSGYKERKRNSWLPLSNQIRAGMKMLRLVGLISGRLLMTGEDQLNNLPIPWWLAASYHALICLYRCCRLGKIALITISVSFKMIKTTPSVVHLSSCFIV